MSGLFAIDLSVTCGTRLYKKPLRMSGEQSSGVKFRVFVLGTSVLRTSAVPAPAPSLSSFPVLRTEYPLKHRLRRQLVVGHEVAQLLRRYVLPLVPMP